MQLSTGRYVCLFPSRFAACLSVLHYQRQSCNDTMRCATRAWPVALSLSAGKFLLTPFQHATIRCGISTWNKEEKRSTQEREEQGKTRRGASKIESVQKTRQDEWRRSGFNSSRSVSSSYHIVFVISTKDDIDQLSSVAIDISKI